VFESKDSFYRDKDCPNNEVVRPFRSVPGTHEECGYLGLILSYMDSQMRTRLT